MQSRERFPPSSDHWQDQLRAGPTSLSRRAFLRDVRDGAVGVGILGLGTAYNQISFIRELHAQGLEDRLSFYQPLDPFPIHGTYLRVIGVFHTRETFADNVQDIRLRVQRAPVVFLEGFWDMIQKRARPGIIVDQQWNDGYDRSTGVDFFSGIGRICAQEGKDIVVVNPENETLKLAELALEYGPTWGIMYSGISHLSRKPMTRRGFLRYMGLGVTALITASKAGMTRKLRSALEAAGILSSDMPENQQADILAWSSWDYRDLRSAEGVERVLKVFSNELIDHNEVVIFEGASHNGKLEYLKNPELRQLKMNFYRHYDLVDTDTIRRYTFNPSDNSWTLKQEIPY